MSLIFDLSRCSKASMGSPSINFILVVFRVQHSPSGHVAGQAERTGTQPDATSRGTTFSAEPGLPRVGGREMHSL